MSHPFGDLVSQHLHRKHGLSQSKLAAGILQAPTIIAKMCKGQRLTGPQARERVLAIVRWLNEQGALDTIDEANAVLNAAGMAGLNKREPAEAALLLLLRPETQFIAAHQPPQLATNLPAPLTSFIGREHELAEIRRLLEAHRLVTLTGAGGVGKTRLAIEVAISLFSASGGRRNGDGGVSRFPDGIWLVECASLEDPALVPQTVAKVFRLHDQPSRSSLDVLVEHLADKRMLLVLDNCEHLIEACAELIERLLQRCWSLRVLATSREALRVPGESVYLVPSLSIPDSTPAQSNRILDYEAARLFVERAHALQPQFEVASGDALAVAHICRQLDGIPLALELAAPLARTLTLGEIVARLEDRLSLLTNRYRTAIPRHRTMRSTIDWSYNLLSLDEQVVFRRLGVFAGGWTLAAAERVVGSPDLSTSVIAGMQSLVNKSLVKQDDAAKGEGDTRFGMLETLREYALERLEESGEAEAVRQRHAAFFVALAEHVQPTMHGDERKIWYTRLDAEQDNFRAALAWVLATGHAELGLRLAGGLGEYWFWWSSHWHEGWSWISQLLALPEAVRSARARAHALRAAVNLLRYLGDNAEADRLADESLALLRKLGDKAGVAWVLADKGWAAGIRADYMEEVRLCEESAALFRIVGDQRGLGWALTWAAVGKSRQGKFEEASGLFGSALAALRQAGDEAMASVCILNLTVQAYHSADYERADVLAHEALALCRKRGDPNGANYALTNLARIALARGDLERAAAQLTASEAWFRQARQTDGLCLVLHDLGYVRHLQGNDRAAGALLHEALALHRQQQQTLLLIESLERCAWIAADRGRSEQAERLFGAAEAARERIGAPLPLGDKPMYDRHLERARADLDETTFNAAWAEGRAMTIEQAIEYALVEH